MYDTKHGPYQSPNLRTRTKTATGFLDGFADDLVGAQYEDDWQALIDRHTAAGRGDLERYRGDHWRRGEIAAEIQGALRTIDQSPQVLETGMRDETGVFAAARKAAEPAMQPTPAVGADFQEGPDLPQVEAPAPPVAVEPVPSGGGGHTFTLRDGMEHYFRGNGETVTMPFSEIDPGLQPRNFEQFVELVNNMRGIDGTEYIDYWKSIDIGGAPGHVTFVLRGTLESNSSAWQFTGHIGALDDKFDFNAMPLGERDYLKEGATRIIDAIPAGVVFPLIYDGIKEVMDQGEW